MQYKITPPNKWLDNKEFIDKKFDLYKKIMDKYEDNETIFKVVKDNGEIKKLTKKYCLFQSADISNQILNLLKRNRNKQIRIFAVIGASEESAMLMLSSLMLCAHHCICFEDLSENAILKRIQIFKPDILIFRKNTEEKVKRLIKRFEICDIPILKIKIKEYENLFIKSSKLEGFSYFKSSNLFTLFTSGSTGMPKAVVHGIDNYIKYSKFTTSYFFGLNKGQTIFSATDAGWINGHTYAFYGPLLLGAISVINENPMFLATPKFLSKILYEVRPNCFYTSVSVLRLLMSGTKSGKSINDFSDEEINLERIGSCGEPLADSVGKWAVDFFKPKRKSIVNTYFQTETGGIIVAPRDEDSVPKDYSCVGRPRKDLGLVIANQIFNELELKNEGLDPNEILICNYWNGIFKHIISDKKSKYFTSQGYFRLNDVGYIEDGCLYIGGRSDDVINVAGHRIASSEIESISMSIDGVNEACAVAIDDFKYGSKVVLFFSSSLTNEKDISNIKLKIVKLIEEQLTQYHLPKQINFFKSLPKTKSGKIMRRIMRLIVEKNYFDESADYSTLENKDQFLKSMKNFLNKKN